MALSVINLFTPSGLRLHAGGTIDVETPPRMSGDQDGWMVASFHVESDQDVHGDHWEIHPAGQEVVSVLSGHARLVLRAEAGQGQDETVTLRPGTGCVIPQNRWHRLEIDGPTDLQAITPRRGSRLEPRA
ncbi:MAG TPA: cupin domain-containing protein [Streptosporangiaceae bacterium]|jgi:mannose-6-phosphate isomerase-like protein (cupin superfamily)